MEGATATTNNITISFTQIVKYEVAVNMLKKLGLKYIISFYLAKKYLSANIILISSR